jgi:hypothetical protein
VDMKAIFNLFRAVFSSAIFLLSAPNGKGEAGNGAHDIPKKCIFPVLFVELFFPSTFVVALFVSNFIERFISGIYVCRTVDENTHSFHETGELEGGAGEKKCLS